MPKNQIVTKEDFQAYIEVQASGVTNMFDVRKVSQLSGLPKNKILKIMKQYPKYMNKWFN